MLQTFPSSEDGQIQINTNDLYKILYSPTPRLGQNQSGTDKSDADAGSISLDDDFLPVLIQRNDAKIIF